MQQVGVDHVRAQVFEGAGERLLDLDRNRSVGIVGKAIVLAAPEGELGLQEQFLPNDDSIFLSDQALYDYGATALYWWRGWLQ